jgi:hypothetical protein
MTWQLSDIRRKVRQLTGRFSTTQLPNTRLDQYINDEYTFSLPNELKLDSERTVYSFNTVPNQAIYPLPLGYVNVEPPIFLDGVMLDYYQSPDAWYTLNVPQISKYIVGVGDGLTAAYTFSVIPNIYISSAIITNNTLTCLDSGVGTWTGDGVGTIDYVTGTVTVTFTSPPSLGTTITFSWQGYQAAVPYSVLYYEDELVFSPIPDSVYRVMIKAFRRETDIVLTSDTPRLEEWGPMIAYGAARQLCSDFGENDRYAELTALYNEQIAIINRRTLNNLYNERSTPSF